MIVLYSPEDVTLEDGVYTPIAVSWSVYSLADFTGVLLNDVEVHVIKDRSKTYNAGEIVSMSELFGLEAGTLI